MGILFSTPPPPELVLATENQGECLIGNLTLGLGKRLKHLKREGDRISCFIETRWLPQREKTVRELHEIIDIHKERNKTIDVVNLSSKCVSAAAKLGTLSVVVCPPAGVAAAAVSTIADGVCAGASVARVAYKEKSLQLAESVLSDDFKRTEQLQELFSSYRLALKPLHDHVEQLREATITGLFDKMKRSPAVDKFLRKIQSTQRMTPQAVAEILKDFANAILDSDAYDDLANGLEEFLRLNPEAVTMLRDGTEFYASSFNMLLVCSELAAEGAWLSIGLNILFIFKDLYDIAALVQNLAGDGSDSTVIKLESIVLRLKDEMDCIKRGIANNEH